ncbi:MAG: dTMP kinase [Actinomycetota bacterium]|nr:dTMP kinase [Actinomycetota bacterium]
MTPGRFIAFEGGDGSGKSTQAGLLAARLGALLTREPGGTAVGERVRAVLLDPDVAHLDPRAEALLMAAARAQHVAEVVRPALAAGRDVVTDRYSHSSIAYQGYGRGLDLAEIRQLSEWATEGLWPDVVVYLEVSPATAATRRSDIPDRLEAEGREFHDRVGAGFRALADAEPDRFLVVSGEGTPDEVAARVWATVVAALGPE